MQRKVSFMLLVVTVAASNISIGQDSSRVFLTTGVGLINVQGKLNNVFKSSVAFNSGVEIKLRHNWFAQLELGFNSLKYDQQVKDENSPYLFQNTNSSLFLAVIQSGRNFHILNPNWFVSVYGGGGYLNIGEPRITVDNTNNIVKQTAKRMSSFLGKAGTRIAYTTRSKFLQTVYIDGSWWISPVKIQNDNLSAFSFFIGTRMAIGN